MLSQAKTNFVSNRPGHADGRAVQALLAAGVAALGAAQRRTPTRFASASWAKTWSRSETPTAASAFWGSTARTAARRCSSAATRSAASAVCITAGSSTSTATASTCPTSPRNRTFAPKVKATAYPAAEYAGLIWIYMGPPEKKPPLPLYQWCARPDADQTTGSKWMQESNYAQALEGNIDSSHVGFLHKTFDHRTFRSAARSRTRSNGRSPARRTSASSTAHGATSRTASTTGA